MITANEVPRDQRIAGHRSYQNPTEPDVVRKAHKHRKSSASGGKRPRRSTRDRTNGPGNGPSQPEQRPPPQRSKSSTSGSSQSRRSQLVDLVVEDQEAEQRERSEARRAFGTAQNEIEHKHYFKYAIPLFVYFRSRLTDYVLGHLPVEQLKTMSPGIRATSNQVQSLTTRDNSRLQLEKIPRRRTRDPQCLVWDMVILMRNAMSGANRVCEHEASAILLIFSPRVCSAIVDLAFVIWSSASILVIPSKGVRGRAE